LGTTVTVRDAASGIEFTWFRLNFIL